MCRSRSGILFSALVALVLCGIGSLGKANGLGTPFYYYSSLIVADAALAAESPTGEMLKFSDVDSYLLSPSMIADSNRGNETDSDEAAQSNAVPEPSGIVIGAFFAALFTLVSLLRWRFDRTAVQS